MPELSPGEWENFLASFPEAHILQTRAWGELKSGFGWKAAYVALEDAAQGASLGAQVLFRKLPFGLSAAYIAKGPVSFAEADLDPKTEAAFWPEVDRLCRKERAIFLKVEPDRWEPGLAAGPGSGIALSGFRPSPQSIQPRRTLVVDLRGSEEQVLARMKQKTRYNIRLAEKKGVVVQPGDDVQAFHHLMTLTGERDLFGVHSLDYYRRAYDLFRPAGACVMLMAAVEGQPVAALMAFYRGERAWYFYGASSNAHRERMPAYLLQWEAIRWARARGCTSYDLWGVPDADEQTLEAGFMKRSGGLWGVYRFKRGFGGELRRAAGPWDRMYQPALYWLYRRWSESRARE